MLTRLIIVILFGSIISWPALSLEPLWKTVGGWDVRVDRTLGHGCFLFNIFESGVIFRIGFNHVSNSTYLMVTDKNWTPIEIGKKYDLQFKFDSENVFSGTSTAIQIGDTSVLMAPVEKIDFIVDFMKKYFLFIDYAGNRIATVSLRGSMAAGAELIRCQEAMLVATPPKTYPISDPFGTSGREPHARPAR